MDKVSNKLTALFESEPSEKEVKLNVMLRSGISQESLPALADELAALSSDKDSVKLLPTADIVSMNGKLDAVPRIASHPDVEWVDQDTEAPIEELLDN
jgi:hypothetical protein